MKKVNIRQEVFKFMKKNPSTKNSEIVEHFPDYPENSVKTYRTQWRKKFKKLIPKKPPKPGKEIVIPETNSKMTVEVLEALMESREYKKIDESAIEDALLELLNAGTVTPQVVRCMVDYIVKIKGKTDTIDDNLDMEALRQIGVSIKGSE